MAEQSAGKGARLASVDRGARLKAALKANMARRKAQARGRAAEAEQDPLGDQTGHQTPDSGSAKCGE